MRNKQIRLCVVLEIVALLFMYNANAGNNTWTFSNTGITVNNFYSYAIAVAPNNQNIIYISGGPGVGGSEMLYRSINGGQSWTRVTTINGFINSIAIDPNNSNIVYLGTQEECLLKSKDGGDTFQVTTTGLINPTSCYQLGIDPVNSNNVYTGGVLSKSTDGGINWSPITTGIRGNGVSTVFTIDPHNPDTLYCVGYINGWVFKSVDGGNSWSVSTNGLPNHTSSGIMVDSQDSNIIYLCRNYGGTFFKSTTGGGSWMQMTTGLENEEVNGMCQDKLNPNIIYVVTWGGGCYRTLDRGSTWNILGTPSYGYNIAMSVSSTTTLIMTGYGILSYTFSTSGIANNEWQNYDKGSVEGLSEKNKFIQN